MPNTLLVFAKHELAGHQMVTRDAQREEHRADARHAGREHDGAVPRSICVILASSALPWWACPGERS